MYGYIYLTINLITGKKYIGQHRSETFDVRYKGSGKLLMKAIKKYGKENFETTVLKECLSEDDLNQSEIEYILMYEATTSNDYYNIAKGGEGHTCDPWNKGLKGLPVSENQLRAFEYGRHLPASAKQKQQLSERRKGCIVSDHTRELLSNNAKGKIAINNGEKTIMIYPQELDNYIVQGWIKGHLKKYSQDSYNKFKNTLANKSEEEVEAKKRQISDTLKSRNRVWLTNGEHSIQIDGINVQEYLDKGYWRGRIIKKKK